MPAINLSRIAKLVTERTPPRQKIEFASIKTSLPQPVISSQIGRLLRHNDLERRDRILLSRAAAAGDAFIGPAIARFAGDLSGAVTTDLVDDPIFEQVLSTLNADLKSWVAKLLTDGELFIHIAPTVEPDGIDAAVSVDREPWAYNRESDEFDRGVVFTYTQDGRTVPIGEAERIVHARIKKIGRYGRPLFTAALGQAKTLADGEQFEAKRWFLSSVITNRHKIPDYFTAEQADEYLKSLAPVDKDDVFRDIATKFDVTSQQGDALGAQMTQMMTYLIGRIDPSSPVPAPFLSSEMAARVNRDTLTQMARDYRSNLASWRSVIVAEIVRPVLSAVAEIAGVDIAESLATVSISKGSDLSPTEVTAVIQTAQQAAGSGLIPMIWVANFIERELGISADDVMDYIGRIDAIDAMDTDPMDGIEVDNDGDQES